MEQKKIKRPISEEIVETGVEPTTINELPKETPPIYQELYNLENEYRRLTLIRNILILQNEIDELTREPEDEKPQEAED